MTKPAPLPPASFVALLDQWPSIRAVAEDMDLSHWTVRGWRRRNFVPHMYWRPLTDAARARGIRGVSYEKFRLVDVAARMAKAAEPNQESRHAAR